MLDVHDVGIGHQSKGQERKEGLNEDSKHASELKSEEIRVRVSEKAVVAKGGCQVTRLL